MRDVVNTTLMAMTRHITCCCRGSLIYWFLFGISCSVFFAARYANRRLFKSFVEMRRLNFFYLIVLCAIDTTRILSFAHFTLLSDQTRTHTHTHNAHASKVIKRVNRTSHHGIHKSGNKNLYIVLRFISLFLSHLT